MRPVRVLFVSSEVAPWSKSGGLGDVAGSLPDALRETGRVEVTVLTPCYRDLRLDGPSLPADRRITVRPGGVPCGFQLERAPGRRGEHTLFARCERLFDRPGLYGERRGDWADNPLRFGAFAMLAAELAVRDGYDVVHAHDWQAALVFEYLLGTPQPARPRGVFTIHNMAFQGAFPWSWLPRLSLRPERATPQGFLHGGRINFMATALRLADVVSTVSPTYAWEITTPEGGFGLDAVLRHDVRRLVGITNGIDDAWNPATDALLPARYSPASTDGKRVCRAALLDRFHVSEPTGRIPVVGMVSRLTSQKGFDVAGPLLRDLLAADRIRFVGLGTGDADLETAMRGLEADFPGRAGARIGYSEETAHLIEGGSDLFLMPSRFEPCGMNQLYSMKYGTPPVVSAVGGLLDTVRDASAGAGGTGFVCPHLDAVNLRETLDRALAAFAEEPRWRAILEAGMAADFSWRRSAGVYADIFQSLRRE